jgi:hypothetical protein
MVMNGDNVLRARLLRSLSANVPPLPAVNAPDNSDSSSSSAKVAMQRVAFWQMIGTIFRKKSRSAKFARIFSSSSIDVCVQEKRKERGGGMEGC